MNPSFEGDWRPSIYDFMDIIEQAIVSFWVSKVAAGPFFARLAFSEKQAKELLEYVFIFVS